MRYFNAKVTKYDETVMEKYGLCQWNESEGRLLPFFASNDMIITNIFKDHSQWASYTPQGNQTGSTAALRDIHVVRVFVLLGSSVDGQGSCEGENNRQFLLGG